MVPNRARHPVQITDMHNEIIFLPYDNARIQHIHAKVSPKVNKKVYAICLQGIKRIAELIFWRFWRNLDIHINSISPTIVLKTFIHLFNLNIQLCGCSFWFDIFGMWSQKTYYGLPLGKKTKIKTPGIYFPVARLSSNIK